ncbi:hypothetical protein V6N11_049777 [Hibiscus sabdariffa]|uniref:Uncharacterized protein n=1 Tax=Hibiscus sabdariffa TaxID=183260 RepID=A0ABR2T8G2_9ROSI
MSVTGENVNLTLSSSTESPKEPEKIEETPTSGTKRRKGKNHVEASPTEGGVGKRKKKPLLLGIILNQLPVKKNVLNAFIVLQRYHVQLPMEPMP